MKFRGLNRRMDPFEKLVLASVYVSKVEPSISYLDRLRSRMYLPIEIFDDNIRHLISNGLLEKDTPPRLTFLGRDAIKVVLVGGVFDVIHPGHIHTLKAAKQHGDVLVVVVAQTSTAAKIKKGRKIYHSENLRKELVSSISFVDLAIIGSQVSLYDTVERVSPDIIALGYDQIHGEKEISENCKDRNLSVRIIRLNTPVPGIKSSQIKDEMGTSIYGI
ncbi:MAG: adenylyltransferase/cytidyltransferase family protein [Nitrososphaeraceae archaeon]